MIRFNNRRYKWLQNYIEIEIKEHLYALGRTNPNSESFMRRWTLTIDDNFYDIRNNIFGWSSCIQDFLYKRGIYWHNWLKDECTRGFECCMNKCKKEKDKNILKNIVRAVEEQSICYYVKDKE